jgi:hypothetical protein
VFPKLDIRFQNGLRVQEQEQEPSDNDSVLSDMSEEIDIHMFDELDTPSNVLRTDDEQVASQETTIDETPDDNAGSVDNDDDDSATLQPTSLAASGEGSTMQDKSEMLMFTESITITPAANVYNVPLTPDENDEIIKALYGAITNGLHAAFNTGSVICYIIAIEMGKTATKANKHKHLQMMVTWELIPGKDLGLVLKEHIQLYRSLIKQVCQIPHSNMSILYCWHLA